MSDDGGMPPMEAGTVVDVLKKLAKGSLVLSNNRNPKAYALVYCYSDWAASLGEKGSKAREVGEYVAKLDRRFATKLLKLECGQAGSAPAFMLKVYTTAVSGGGSYTPPTEPAGSSTTDLAISSLMWWFIYLVVMLAPAYFLGVFCKMGKWGFLLGLGIGSGIGYGFIAGFPVWLLLVVVVGLVGMIWKDRGM